MTLVSVLGGNIGGHRVVTWAPGAAEVAPLKALGR